MPGLATGLSIQLPASGRTDPGYWVVPDILRHAEEARLAQGDGEQVRLGVLVNEAQVNSKHFVYLAYEAYPKVGIEELATLGWEQPVYPRLFDCDLVLLIDPPPHYPRRPDAEATLERLTAGDDNAFHRAFALAETYPLPDGRRLLLYERRFPGEPVAGAADYRALATDLAQRVAADGAVAVVPPGEVYPVAAAGDGPLPLYPLQAPVADGLEALAQVHDSLWLVLGDVAQADPDGALARTLAAGYYPAGHAWYGPLQLVLYGTPAAPWDGPGGAALDPAAAWTEGITLDAYRFADRTVKLGGVVRLDLAWRATESVADRYKVFLHLIDGEGQVVAQRDGEPGAGIQRMDVWVEGEVVRDRHGLWLPTELAPGAYQLLLGLYDPDSGERVAVCCPEGDAWHLASVRIEDGIAEILPPDGN
jgi:hypothetical protein